MGGVEEQDVLLHYSEDLFEDGYLVLVWWDVVGYCKDCGGENEIFVHNCYESAALSFWWRVVFMVKYFVYNIFRYDQCHISSFVFDNSFGGGGKDMMSVFEGCRQFVMAINVESRVHKARDRM